MGAVDRGLGRGRKRAVVIRIYTSAATTLSEVPVTVERYLTIRCGRYEVCLKRKTDAGLKRDVEAAEWSALREQAVEATDRETVEWALEDLYGAGGTDVTAKALLRRIRDGLYKAPWESL